MQRRAEARDAHAEAGRFRRFSEMVDRPMGILDAVEAVIREPASVEGLSALLTAANGRVRERTAWALGYAAAKGASAGR